MKVEQSVLGLKAHIKVNKYIRTTGISASVLLFVLSMLSTFPITSRDNSAEATANPSTTTLEITSSSNLANVKLDVNSTSGNFASSNSPVAFSVITDNITGYSLSISGSDTSGKLVNETISTASLDSITSPLSRDSFAYGSSASAYNGKWGIKPSKYLSAANDNYLPAPTTDSILMDTTSAPNATANEYTIGLGARADFSTPAGTYSNTFVVQAVGRPVMYAINYLDTTEDDTVADLPETDSSSTSTAINFILDPNSPTREGYTFIGWCDGTVNHANTPSTCDGTTYMPSATYIFEDSSASTTNIANFYAMWKEAEYTITFNTVNAASIEFDGVTYTNGQTVSKKPGTYSLRGNYDLRYAFQSWSATAGTISNSDYVDYNLNTYTVVEEDATITLTGQYVETEIQKLAAATCTSTPMPTYDNRDGQVYWVKRLDDGNCWMMDNLNLGAIDLTEDLTSANTNLADTISAATFNGYRRNVGSASSTSADFITITKANSATGDVVDAVSGTKFGTLYNYCATSAGTYCYDPESGTGNATYDICPAGWRLFKSVDGPSANPDNEVYYFYTNPSYNTDAKLQVPVSENGAAFAHAGYYYDNGPIQQGQERVSGYWSSSRAGSNDMYILNPDSNFNTYHAASSGYRVTGRSIRCIRDTSLDTIYMQDVTSDMVSNMAEGDILTVKDRRDNEEYKVTKLKDGKVWMIDNLRLDPTATGLDVLKGNTNATDEILTYYKNGGGSSPYPANGVSSDWTGEDQDSYELPYINADSKDVVTSVAYGEGSGKVGVYYNYCAASAGSYCYAGNTEAGNASYDICPKNWRLPVGGSDYDEDNEFKKLYVLYNYDQDVFKAALGAHLTGYFRSGMTLYQGNDGRFWSSAAASGNNGYMRILGSYSSYVINTDYYPRINGYSVRCVFKGA